MDITTSEPPFSKEGSAKRRCFHYNDRSLILKESLLRVKQAVSSYL